MFTKQKWQSCPKLSNISGKEKDKSIISEKACGLSSPNWVL